MTATLLTPRARAHALAARLAARLADLGELGEVVAEVVDPDGPPCLDGDCQHRGGGVCTAAPRVVVLADDPLNGTPLPPWRGCGDHAQAWVTWLLPDYDEPRTGRVLCEVTA